MRLNSFFIFLLFCTTCFFVQAQDTLRLQVKSADSIFLSNNLLLLAAALNVNAEQAQIIQAKLYPNPVFSAEMNAYDPEHKKALNIGHSGQKSFQLEQLILLGGKRKIAVDIAKTHAALAQLELQELLLQLKFQLHTGLFAVGHQQQLLALYNRQLQLLADLLSAYEKQAAKGNIALKDVVRLKGAYLKLNNDRAGVINEIYNAQTNLQTLLGTTAFVTPDVSSAELEKYVQPATFAQIKEAAFSHRPDLHMLQQSSQLAGLHLQYQKAMAVPDPNFFIAHDQNSGAFRNQVSIGLSIPLPLWSRNQGNIKTAQFRQQQAAYQLQQRQQSIEAALQNAYAHHRQSVAEYHKAKALFNDDFDVTVNAMVINFQKRNVSIVEFIDFFEAYNEVLTEITRINQQLVVSGEQLNLLTGNTIY